MTHEQDARRELDELLPNAVWDAEDRVTFDYLVERREREMGFGLPYAASVLLMGLGLPATLVGLAMAFYPPATRTGAMLAAGGFLTMCAASVVATLVVGRAKREVLEVLQRSPHQVVSTTTLRRTPPDA